MQTPAAEIDIDLALVKSLLQAQHPDLANLSISYLSEGWDNVIYRLGNKYLLRLPRRTQAVPFIEREQLWLPRLAPQLPIPIPAPVRVGVPQGKYPWPWSITPWFMGANAATALPDHEEASHLARFLKALHQPAPVDAPHNPFRACPLRERAAQVEERITRFVAEGIINEQIIQVWSAALAAPPYTAPLRFIHGDLHPKNIVVHQGKFSAIIDWGDMTAGDPATDLASFWMLFGDAQARKLGLDAYAPDPALLTRAKGWAIFFGTILLDIGKGGDPLFEKVGRFTLKNLAMG